MEFEFHKEQEGTPKYRTMEKRYKRSADWDLREEINQGPIQRPEMARDEWYLLILYNLFKSPKLFVSFFYF